MIFKILKSDILKNKSFALILALFVFIAAFLITASVNMMMEMSSSLSNLFVQTKAPHFVQMHEGTINKKSIEEIITKNKLIQNYQLVEMLMINQGDVFIGNNNSSQKDSVINIDFVIQNKLFDYLINLQGKVINPMPGQVAVPVYYMQKLKLKIGDKLTITNHGLKKEFTIVDFTRDLQMNPAIVHSKRFLVNPKDFEVIKKDFVVDKVYLLEFQLKDLKYLSEFSRNYSLVNFPQNGPALDYNLFKVLNYVTDGVVIAVIIFISFLFVIIAILSLRFTLLATLEEEYKQIGLMKAIGIPQQSVKLMYLIKYIFLAGLACLLGYEAYQFCKEIFIANITLYFGNSSDTAIKHILPFLAVCLLFAIISMACFRAMKKIHAITVVDVLRTRICKDTVKNSFWALKRSSYRFLNIFLGIKDVGQRFKLYSTAYFIFMICSFVIILALNFFNTIKSPAFITYLGVGQSDIRIDLRSSAMTSDNLQKIITYLEQDKSVKKLSSLITARFKLKNNQNKFENVNIETGDFTVFPLNYIDGYSPQTKNNIALSYLLAKELQKNVGDYLEIFINNRAEKFKISGIYQDITNGGKTAKGFFPINPHDILWSVINVDIISKNLLANKIKEYSKVFYSARVTGLHHYIQETLGDLINQIKMIAILAVLIGILLAILITSLFLKLLVMKDYPKIAVMKAMGFSLQSIRTQYLTKMLLVLNLGVITGAIVANTFGMKLVGVIWSFMGAPAIQFIIDPMQVYILYPLILMIAVTLTTILSIRFVKNVNITNMILE